LVYPKAETQAAVVTDNNDPAGMGRIKVKFFWNHESDWTRLVTPHAGSGKGFYFIPEIGEEVFVSFEGGTPEKPFVIGTQYNGAEISGYNTSGNDQKVIHTRSGTKMIFNDAQGSIFIEDPSGNTWLMDGQGNISVNAPNDISITAGKNMSINVGQNLSVIAGVDITETAGANKNLIAGALHNVSVGKNYLVNVMGSLLEIVKGNRESETTERTEIAKSAQLSTTEKSIVVNASQKVVKKSGEKSNAF
jgi:uncharacterized protein involved in type VI secretion and phage assembly